MRLRLHISVLLLFVLTQCFAPLVHAHVDGIQGESSFHAHDIQSLSYQELSQCFIEPDESQAISLPSEHPRDDELITPKDIALPTHPISPYRADGVSQHPEFRPAVAAYHWPHTHAPPA